jgi:glycosyltransferase involved in cell wall biosynthesis
MKILMLTPYLPYPPSSGGQVRSYNLIKHLARRHEITLFSLIKNDREREYTQRLEELCQKIKLFKRPERPWTARNILRTGFGFYPFLVIRNLSPEEKGAVIEELKKNTFDLIHAETFYVMPHIPPTKVPILLVEQTIEYRVYLHYAKTFRFLPVRPLLFLDVLKLKFWEARFWKQANKVVAVSEADKEEMLALVPSLDVGIVPNGAGEDLVGLWGKREPDFKKPIIFYQGNFLWLQNIEAAKILAEKIFPLIKREIPEARCHIVGQGAREKVSNLSGNGVEVRDLKTSDVEGVKQAYREATVFVGPLAGPGGTRLKILGAMAAGVPVVTTLIGIEGIEAGDGREVLVRDTEKGLVEAVISLIKDPKLHAKIANAARKLASGKYSWEKIAESLDQIYQEVSQKQGPGLRS